MLHELTQLVTEGRPVAARMLIGGHWGGSAAAGHEIENPADETIIATTPAGTADTAAEALQAARRAQPGWAMLP
ncbi:MAG: aldehyde dehydrogenase family protein, partial [Paracoccus sp.]|nr:aldehyde dehydrogenase family protein [Paracoccus sp. (in: a-proteobacteria)]